MSIIKLPLRYEGSQGEKYLYTLFDSGATFSCISPECADGLANLEKLFRPMEVATAAVGHYLKINHRITVDFYIDDVSVVQGTCNVGLTEGNSEAEKILVYPNIHLLQPLFLGLLI